MENAFVTTVYTKLISLSLYVCPLYRQAEAQKDLQAMWRHRWQFQRISADDTTEGIFKIKEAPSRRKVGVKWRITFTPHPAGKLDFVFPSEWICPHHFLTIYTAMTYEVSHICSLAPLAIVPKTNQSNSNIASKWAFGCRNLCALVQNAIEKANRATDNTSGKDSGGSEQLQR